MKRKTKILIIILAIVVILFITIRDNGTRNHSTVTSCLVIDKESNPFSITIKIFGETKDTLKEVEILVRDENTWNLIEKNRFYFVNFYWENNEIPELGQIEINDKFGELYGDEFNRRYGK